MYLPKYRPLTIYTSGAKNSLNSFYTKLIGHVKICFKAGVFIFLIGINFHPQISTIITNYEKLPNFTVGRANRDHLRQPPALGTQSSRDISVTTISG